MAASLTNTIFELDKLMNHTKLTVYNATISVGKFIVGSLTDKGISFASNPVLHPTGILAQQEVERLSKLNPGTTYVYVQLKGGATANQVTRF